MSLCEDVERIQRWARDERTYTDGDRDVIEAWREDARRLGIDPAWRAHEAYVRSEMESRIRRRLLAVVT